MQDPTTDRRDSERRIRTYIEPLREIFILSSIYIYIYIYIFRIRNRNDRAFFRLLVGQSVVTEKRRNPWREETFEFP